MYSIKLEGAEELRRRMAHIKGGFRKVIEDALRLAATHVEEEAKRQVNLGGREHLKYVTGNLQRSIGSRATAGGLSREIAPGLAGGNAGKVLKYAAIHEYGGIIRPKTPGGVLVFRVETAQRIGQYRSSRRKDTSMSNVIFAKQVTIPARPYLGPAMTIQRPAVQRTFERRIRELLDGR